MVDEGEECDTGVALADSSACTTACKNAQCGDGHVYAGMEQCDDGNMDNTDQCTTICAPPTCADGLVSGAETGVDCGGICDPCPLPASCAQILSVNPDADSGVFEIDPDGGEAIEPLQIYCDMQTDGGGWSLVWKVSYYENNQVPDDTWRFYSTVLNPCVDYGGGRCNVPNKLVIGESEMRVTATHNAIIVYDFKGDLNPLLDTSWEGGILDDWTRLVDHCQNADHGMRPEPENGAHAFRGVTWDKWENGNYLANCDTDRYGSNGADCRWSNCGLPPEISESMSLVQMTMHVWVR